MRTNVKYLKSSSADNSPKRVRFDENNLNEISHINNKSLNVS